MGGSTVEGKSAQKIVRRGIGLKLSFEEKIDADVERQRRKEQEEEENKGWQRVWGWKLG